MLPWPAIICLWAHLRLPESQLTRGRKTECSGHGEHSGVTLLCLAAAHCVTRQVTEQRWARLPFLQNGDVMLPNGTKRVRPPDAQQSQTLNINGSDGEIKAILFAGCQARRMGS